MTRLVPLAALALAAPGVAAQDLDLGTSATLSTQSMTGGAWDGFYAGGSVGGAFGDTDGFFALDTDLDGNFGDDPGAGSAPFTNETGDFEGGSAFGVHVGYDRRFGDIVAGGVFDFSSSDASDFQTGRSATPADYTINRELDSYGTLRGRVGYVFNDRFLAYGTAGVAFGEVDESFESDTAAASVESGGDGTDVGYAIGAGVETMVTDRVSVGIEYLYANLGDSDYNVNLSGPGAFSAIAGSTDAQGSDRDFDFSTIAIKVSYRF